MAQKQNKKQKRDKKKRLANKASATRHHMQNKDKKRMSVIEKPSTLSFIQPKKFYIGCENEVIGDAEVQFMESGGPYAEGIEVGIYPATENFKRFITARMSDQAPELSQFHEENWIVVKLKDMLYIDAFIKLDDAKEYVMSNFPNVKVIRLDSLGTKDLPFGEFEFPVLPHFNSATKEDWIKYALQCEDEFGFRFDADEVIWVVLQELVDEHQANSNLLEEFDNQDSLESALKYVANHGFIGAEIGLNTLREFHSEYARFR